MSEYIPVIETVGDCPCGGQMRNEKGMLLCTQPPKELHVCNKCRRREIMTPEERKEKYGEAER